MGGSKGGVQVPQSQLMDADAHGEPLSIPHLDIGFMVPLVWHDEAGRQHNDVFMLVGDIVYVPPGSERWAAELSPAKASIQSQVKAKFKSRFKQLITQVLSEMGVGDKPKLPTKDDVDILAEEMSGAGPSAG